MTQIFQNSSTAESTSSAKAIDGITFESVRRWSIEQVSNWLQENNFKEHQKLFAENDINGDVLLEIDHEVLRELKIKSVGDRMRLIAAVRNLLKTCAGNSLNCKYPKVVKITLSRSNSNSRVLVRSNSNPRMVMRSNSTSRGNKDHYKPPAHTKQKSVEFPMSLESVMQRCIKVYGEEGQTRTIPINNITDAKSILARILQKFNINEDTERYSLFATLSDARSLTDEEIVNICTSANRPERERLTLRKKHLPMSHEQKKEQMRTKKLEYFFGEQPPAIQQTGIAGITHRKLRNFFGQRPPSELISSNLMDYFPGHATEDLERSARNSIRRSSRRMSSASRVSRTKSRRISRTFDDVNNNRLSTILSPSINLGDHYDISIPEEESDKDDFIKWMKGDLIGKGSFGSVYLGLNSATGELMAVKQVELPTGTSAHEERKKSMVNALQREIALLKELQHENIVQYLGSQHDDETLNIFLEYVPGGSVTTMLNNYGALEEPLVKLFVRQILQGLKYLHGKDIIHRDIKGANILVDNKGRIKISDFGISKKVEDQIRASISVHRPSLQGSVFWMAPEVVKQTAYTSKADIWSLGCLIVEMFTGTHPFPEFNQMQAMFKIGTESCAPEIPNNISDEAQDFLKKTFEPNHNDRPTADVLSIHPFATSANLAIPQ
ncbi:3042_t:CDS:10 [Gigaspora margarita]|uniref:mitogen-activated protein kinase kinase kinase n=1 Tax=Gigaspora margarita TaxID=4874 RepID=A0ABN7V199_GIGMA|nr:3042_t:CDS:10 [Gigaspora margarita]